MFKKIVPLLLILSLFIPSSFASNNSIEINLDNYTSTSDKYNYSVWTIDDHKLPLYGEFSIRFNTNLYYKDIETIALIKDNIQIPMKTIINNASVDCTIMESLIPNQDYKIVFYLKSKYKYTLNFISKNYGDLEPNNTPLQSNVLILGDKIKGTIEKDNPDFFTFDIVKPTEVKFDIKRDDNKEIYVKPFVLDEFGNEYLEEDKELHYEDTRVLYKNYFLPGKYYLKIVNNLDNPARYVLETEYKLLASYYERTDNNSFENSEQIFSGSEIGNNLNYYQPDGNFDTKDVYDFYIPDNGTKVKIDYESNKKGNYVIIYKYKDPYKYDVVEEYKNKAADFEDKLVLDDGHYFIEVWNKAYKGVNYKIEVDFD
jgi:hypothetical protein